MTFQVFHDLYEPCCLIVFFDREQFNRHLFTLFNYCCLSVIAIVLSSAVTYLSHKLFYMTFKDRQLNSMTFQDWKMKFLNSTTFQVFHGLYKP